MVGRAKAAPDDKAVAPRRSSRHGARRSPPRRMKRPASCCPTTPTTKGTRSIPSPRSPSWRRASTRCRRWSPDRQPRVIVGGYIDLGFFVPQGNGSGIIRDQGNVLLPAVRGQVRLGVPGRHPRHRRSTRAARWRISATPPAPPPRFDSIHSGGAPGFIANEINMTLTSGLAPSAVATASINFMPAQRLELQPGRLRRRRHRPARVDADPLAEDLDLRRQVRLGARHRVPRAQVEPALRHHAVAHRALHDRHGDRREGALQVRPRRSVRGRRGASPTARSRRSSFTSTTRSTPTSARPASGRLSLHPPIPLDMELGRLGLVRPPGSLAQRRRQDVVLGRRLPASRRRASTSRRSTCEGAAPGDAGQRRLRPAACTAAATSSWTAMLVPLTSACSAASSIATPSSGWAIRPRPEAPTAPT